MILPIRKPVKPVHVIACSKDNVCPAGGSIVMLEWSFRNFLENTENTETYIKQLEELLKPYVR